LIASTGHTWTEVRDDWDLPRLIAWTEYSSDHPPLHLMVASYLGIKPRISKPTEADNEAAAAFLLSVPELARK
jgi:hypothetical protein